MVIIMADGTDIVVLPPGDHLVLFTTEKAIDPILARLRQEIDHFVPDTSTKRGREEIASFAFKVSRSKTYLDGIGKELTDKQKEVPKKIDATRKRIRDTLDAWRDEVRAPLDEWEAAEATRVAEIKTRLAVFEAAIGERNWRSSDDVRDRLAQVRAETINAERYAEYLGAAGELKDKAVAALETALLDHEKREAEAAELMRLRAEAAERERKAREEQAKRDAEEHDRKVAEAAAASERATAEAAAKAAQDEAARRERDHKTALEAAERRAAEAAARVKAEAEQAALRDAADKARREADREHRAKINRAALAAFVEGGISDDIAKAVVTLIAAGTIPAITINY